LGQDFVGRRFPAQFLARFGPGFSGKFTANFAQFPIWKSERPGFVCIDAQCWSQSEMIFWWKK